MKNPLHPQHRIPQNPAELTRPASMASSSGHHQVVKTLAESTIIRLIWSTTFTLAILGTILILGVR
jgi:hypothetical protein